MKRASIRCPSFGWVYEMRSILPIADLLEAHTGLVQRYPWTVGKHNLFQSITDRCQISGKNIFNVTHLANTGTQVCVLHGYISTYSKLIFCFERQHSIMAKIMVSGAKLCGFKSDRQGQLWGTSFMLCVSYSLSINERFSTLQAYFRAKYTIYMKALLLSLAHNIWIKELAIIFIIIIFKNHFLKYTFGYLLLVIIYCSICFVTASVEKV